MGMQNGRRGIIPNRPAQAGLNTGQYLPGVKGLGDVVIRPLPEQFHLALHVGLGGNDDDRYCARSADFYQKLLTMEAGEHQVQ